MTLTYPGKIALKPAGLAFSALLLAACGTEGPVSSSDSSSSPQSSVSTSSSTQPPSSSSSSSSSSGSNDGPASLLNSGGTFDDGQEYFSSYVNAEESASATITYNGEVNADISAIAAAAEAWHVQIQHLVGVTSGETYTVCYKAKADATRTMVVDIDTGDPDYASVNDQGAQTVALGTSYQNYSQTLQANVTNNTARLLFNVGDSTINVQIDDIGVFAGSECGTPGVVDSGDPGTGSGNVEGVVPITTQGNQVLFGGEPASIAGMSLFWSNWDDGSVFYNEGVVDTVDSWGGKLIRAAMGVEVEDGYLLQPEANENRVRTIVDAAIANDMYVIIDWHTHSAEEYPEYAVEFFEKMARDYGEYDNVIYEIYNEPDCPAGVYPCSWSERTQWSEIKSYAEGVISAIRAIDDDNLIIVGTPFYSQDVDEAAADPIQGYDNIAYTLHFYAGTHTSQLRSKALTALAQGIPLFVTEWGTVDADGDGAVATAEAQTWMDFLYENNISHANWSVSDKEEGASLLNPGADPNGNWSDNDLSESGRFVKDVIENW